MLNRRIVVAGGLAAVTSSLPVPAWSAPDQDFMKLSTALIGAGDLDADLGRAYGKALRAGSQGVAIDRLVGLAGTRAGGALLDRIRHDNLNDAANLVVAAWYSGVVDGQVITYTDALAWNAVPFTKPNGSCGGAFGYWAEPPAK